MIYMAITKEQYERLLKRLDAIQEEIEEIHRELLTEVINDDEVSESERKEIESIMEENDFRTIEDWKKEEPLD